MRASNQRSERALVIAFLVLIGTVPLAQIGLELARRERVQCTDVFRTRLEARALREFEDTLEARSWFRQQLRPLIQRGLFALFRDTGTKAVLGRDQWLFYRPDLRYVVEPDRVAVGAGDSDGPRFSGAMSRREAVVHAITRFRDQLRERGIALVVVPVPGKPSVYPDRLSSRVASDDTDFRSPTLDLIEGLRREQVPTVDLFATFRAARPEAKGTPEPGALYLARDTHWTPRGAQLAAVEVAARLRALGVAPPPTTEYRTRSVSVARWGDILDLMQIPGLRDVYAPELVECQQVLDPTLGLLLPSASDRPGTYQYPGQKAKVLVLGDSFCRIYQSAEPRSLGELEPGSAAAEPRPAPRVGDPQREAREPAPQPVGRGGGPNDDVRGPAPSSPRRLLPGSAGFLAHLALALGAPVDSIVSDGGASTDVRRRLSTHPEILEGKQVVIWEFVERDIALGPSGWQDVPLPRRLD